MIHAISSALDQFQALVNTIGGDMTTLLSITALLHMVGFALAVIVIGIPLLILLGIVAVSRAAFRRR